MLVTVIVATRNRPALLKVALESIASQSYSALDVILVDDGSDESEAKHNKACGDAIKSLKVTYLRLPRHGSGGNGPSYARNEGINAASGALIAFCDDDDQWIDQRYIEDSVRCFENDARVDLVFANQLAFRADALDRDIWQPQLVRRLADRLPLVNIPVDREDCLVCSGDFAHLNSCVFRREVLLGLNGFWESARYAEDLDLYVRAVDVCDQIVYRHQAVSRHNIPDKSKTSNASTQQSEGDRQLTLVNIAAHLLHACNHPASRRYATELGGTASRRLTLLAVKAGNLHRAAASARQAYAWYPTYKWGLYSFYIRMRAAFSRPPINENQ